MSIDKAPSPIQGYGEYGATTVELTKNGDAYRLAFGRWTGDSKVFLGAVIMTNEAFSELKAEIEGISE